MNCGRAAATLLAPAAGLLLALTAGCAREGPLRQIKRDDAAGVVRVLADEQELLAYQYGEDLALPHLWPLRSPTGRHLTVQHPDPFPHHRSVWIADKVQLGDGPVVDFYHCHQNLRNPEHPELGYRHFIRHRSFEECDWRGEVAVVDARLDWIVDEETVVLEERRTAHVVLLGDGEYRLDLEWTLTAAHGPVTFHSDWVHYAWPYVRMHPRLSGESGGTIQDDQGRRGQEATNEQYARWIDYSNTVDGITEGLTIFLSGDGVPRKWLTREYGTFGPRRSDEQSGTRFTLAQGESLQSRAAILVHGGDAQTGRVAERYREYADDIPRSAAPD